MNQWWYYCKGLKWAVCNRCPFLLLGTWERRKPRRPRLSEEQNAGKCIHSWISALPYSRTENKRLVYGLNSLDSGETSCVNQRSFHLRCSNSFLVNAFLRVVKSCLSSSSFNFVQIFASLRPECLLGFFSRFKGVGSSPSPAIYATRRTGAPVWFEEDDIHIEPMKLG